VKVLMTPNKRRSWLSQLADAIQPSGEELKAAGLTTKRVNTRVRLKVKRLVSFAEQEGDKSPLPLKPGQNRNTPRPTGLHGLVRGDHMVFFTDGSIRHNQPKRVPGMSARQLKKNLKRFRQQYKRSAARLSQTNTEVPHE
jgi:hypothetical protein